MIVFIYFFEKMDLFNDAINMQENFKKVAASDVSPLLCI